MNPRPQTYFNNPTITLLLGQAFYFKPQNKIKKGNQNNDVSENFPHTTYIWRTFSGITDWSFPDLIQFIINNCM